MKKFGEILKGGDWKNEKHVPAITAPEEVVAEQAFTVTVEVGADIAHPNTTEHHIRWIKLFFQPDEGFTYEVSDIQFTAHGESVAGADQGPVYTEAKATIDMKVNTSGTLMALSYCNIHGLWESSQRLVVK